MHEIRIVTQDGTATARLFRPTERRELQAGVIIYMDAFGLRPGLYEMGQRMAQAGYVVLVPDLFYRFGEYQPFDAKTAFADPATRDRLMGMIKGTTQDMTRRDSAAFLDAIGRETKGKVGVVGYCMGGGRALNAAAAYPERIAAAASIHGGNLASDDPDSPHRHAGRIKGRVYVASAGVDQSFPPEQSARLAEALRRAEVDHIIENYVGMQHGWAVPDHAVYNEQGAERHWKRLLTLFDEALG